MTRHALGLASYDWLCCHAKELIDAGYDRPRGLDFLLSRNRLNVAISRAQCLAYLICSPPPTRSRLQNHRTHAACQRALPLRRDRRRTHGEQGSARLAQRLACGGCRGRSSRLVGIRLGSLEAWFVGARGSPSTMRRLARSSMLGTCRPLDARQPRLGTRLKRPDVGQRLFTTLRCKPPTAKPRTRLAAALESNVASSKRQCVCAPSRRNRAKPPSSAACRLMRLPNSTAGDRPGTPLSAIGSILPPTRRGQGIARPCPRRGCH
jgi:hypothetical protein